MLFRTFFGRSWLGCALLLALLTLPLSAATVPAGFTESLFVTGIDAPTTMQFAPDGRLFVLEQAGQVRVIANGQLLPTPFISLTVDDSGERGLLGIAFDPAFASEPWVYLYYTVPGVSGGPPHNRIIRVMADGNVSTGTPETVLDLDDLDSAQPPYHNGGAMDFGPDGYLYVGVGENMRPQLAQDMTTRLGKLLRITRTGGIPTDNPFYATASGVNRAIWALGLRNPNNFSFNPGGSPAMLINDVGQSRWEEINAGEAGANYGWPTAEGPDETGTPNPAFTYPLFSYFHSQGCAIIGSAPYAPGTVTFPAEYQGGYFFADYCNGWLAAIDPAAPVPPTQNGQGPFPRFAEGLVSPVDVRVGDDGALYYLARPGGGLPGSVYRIQYGSGAPGITTPPASVSVAPGQQATFSVVANGSNLTYQWQRNRANITGATSATYSFPAQAGDNGAQFRVLVTNSGGTATSSEATLTVSSNQAPVATITQPTAGLTYGGGQTITYAGTGTDPEDGPLGAAAYTWRIDFHHADHVHPFLPATSGTTGGTFVVPNTGHTETNVYFRLTLTVTDSAGATHSVSSDVVPRVVQLTLNSAPQGRPLLLDAQPVTTPYVTTSVEGVIRTIEAQTHTDGPTPYTFTGWSDGGAAQHDIVTPATDAAYTASFGIGAAAPTAFTLAANGATVTATWNRAGGATSYRLEVGTASGQADLLNVDVGDVAFVQGVVPAGSYVGRVRAVYPSAVSAPSAEASAAVTSAAACEAPPPVPANYVARAGGLTAALSWLPSAAATSYQLVVGSVSGAADVLVADLGNVTSFLGTAPAGSYFTSVRAVNACGVSAPSVEAGVVLACTPDAVVPAGLTASAANGIATLTWQAPLGATGYRVLVGTAPGATLLETEVGTATSVAVPLAGVPPGVYYVRVAATSACGVGLPSNEVTLTVP